MFLQVRYKFAVTFLGQILIYNSSVCFLLVKTCKEVTEKLLHISKIIGIQWFSSQLYEIIDYLLILAEVECL